VTWDVPPQDIITREAAAKLAEAAAVLNREPVAITLRYLQTSIEIGTEKNTTIVFPLPIDLLGGLGARLNAGEARLPAVPAPELTTK
jgi:hypothetical protein